jgi:hypothetical protein
MLNTKHAGHVQDAIEHTSIETPFAYLKPDVAPTSASGLPVAIDDAPPSAADPAVKVNSTIRAGHTYDGIRFRVGENATGDRIPAPLIPPEDDLSRDLPRIVVARARQ